MRTVHLFIVARLYRAGPPGEGVFVNSEALDVPPAALLEQLAATLGGSTLPPDAICAERDSADHTWEAVIAAHAHATAAGWQVRCAGARSPSLALTLASWHAEDVVVESDHAPELVSGLPLRSLGLPEQALSALARRHVRTVGAFAALPRTSVLGVCGERVLPAHDLARSLTTPRGDQALPSGVTRLLVAPSPISPQAGAGAPRGHLIAVDFAARRRAG